MARIDCQYVMRTRDIHLTGKTGESVSRDRHYQCGELSLRESFYTGALGVQAKDVTMRW